MGRQQLHAWWENSCWVMLPEAQRPIQEDVRVLGLVTKFVWLDISNEVWMGASLPGEAQQ